ncbi:MAG: hypothetical protein DYG92_03315 [Leptolyngbya sp. PLA1]|nr:hypothetical protein [Leptolyngbya sp. PLA1]
MSTPAPKKPRRSTIGTLLLPWTCRWNLLRIALAGFALWVLIADSGARLARMQMAVLPDFDFASEVRALRLEGRYGEAVMIADAGLRSVEGEARANLEAERALTIDEQQSLLRRAKDVGVGALTGSGETLERVVGAVAADFFVVGDVRDLLIQGGRQLIDGESDEVILALSVVGVVTTLAPEIDWAPSILKAAKRGGHMTEAMGKRLLTLIRGRATGELEETFRAVAATASGASPGTAMRVLRHAESTEDLTRLASFVKRHPDAGLALHVGGAESVRIARSAAEAGEAGLRTQAALVRASRKGPAGVRLFSATSRALTRPHPLLGIAKAIWKGNAETMLTRLTDRIDGLAAWLVPALAAWLAAECGLLWRRVTRP